ncbi:GntR family transcriptional regulator [Austwickia chelonae]|uniref:GntR family transcriptional regulator n=1 Tax=Austwickia chelonae TaxID=100225 RepID=UPI000E282435|nr:GntR family transcriptional regulator [Austwickia chelonae]
MDVILSHTSGVPLYEQIKTQIKMSIARGDLEEGDALPSVRGLARDLRVSVITTTRAFSELSTEGYIINIPKKGSYVAKRDEKKLRSQALDEIQEHLRNAIQASRLIPLSDREFLKIAETLLEE